MNKRTELVAYLVVTFGLTYLIQYIGLNKGELINGGYLGGLTPEMTVAFQFAMYIPALVAIIMNTLVQKKGLYVGKVRWFINYYLLLVAEMTVSFIAVTILGLHESNPVLLQIVGSITGLTGILGTVLLLALNIKPAWRADLAKAKLNLGNIKHYILFAGLLAVFLTVGAYIDLYAGLGTDPGTDINTLLFGAINALLLSPILGLTTGVFGEEYGWRIYLQDLLTEQYGKPLGVLILGVIWGLWHAPVVLMGWTYPGYGIIGVVVFTVFTTIIGGLLSHATFVSGTVWVTSYIHAVNNAYGNFTLNLVAFHDPVYNFRLGIYGLAILSVIVLYIINRRKDLWVQK